MSATTDLTPGSAAWTRLVSASKVGVILGVSPWQSPYALWRVMHGDVPRVDADSNASRRGTYLESGVISWWLDQHPEVTAHTEQVTLRLGDWGIATPDVVATIDGAEVPVEVKTTSSWDEWGQPGTDQVPAHYYAQVVWQLACLPRAPRAHLAALGPFLDFREYVIERDDDLIADVVARCRAFYDSLTDDVPPPLDDSVATLATLRAEHPEIARGTSKDIEAETARAWLVAKTDLAAADRHERGLRSLVLRAMGDAQYLTAAGVRVARRQASRNTVALVATATADELPTEEA